MHSLTLVPLHCSTEKRLRLRILDWMCCFLGNHGMGCCFLASAPRRAGWGSACGTSSVTRAGSWSGAATRWPNLWPNRPALSSPALQSPQVTHPRSHWPPLYRDHHPYARCTCTITVQWWSQYYITLHPFKYFLNIPGTVHMWCPSEELHWHTVFRLKAQVYICLSIHSLCM